MTAHRAPILGCLLMAAIAASDTSAQSLRAAAGASFEHYKFGDAFVAGASSVSLITIPLAAQLRIANRGLIDVTAAFASGSLERADGSSASLSGPTDTELRASWPFEAGNLTVTVMGALTLPTGHGELTTEELEVAGVMASDLLPFRIASWGTGGGAALHLSVARATELLNYGASVSYRRSSEFSPIEGASANYRPGDELRVKAAVDRSVASGAKVSLQLTLSTFSDDALDGEELYKSGTRIQGVGFYEFPVAGSSASIYAGVLRRSGSALNEDGVFRGSSALSVSPSQTLVLAGSSLRARLGNRVATPSIELRALRSEDGIGQGWMASAGSTLELPIGISATLIPVARIRIGSLTAADSNSSILGFEAGAGIRFGAR
jgi:hypothetical protein